MAKRLFDIIAALAGLVLVAPLLLILGIAIKFDSPGPVLYRSVRAGKNGVPFPMLKLRTMVVGADRMGSALTFSADPRITRTGRFLRRYKLDELPQLINVLRGEMSIVGPRPESPCYVQKYSPEQRRVLEARPGITGQAQIVFRHEESLLTDLKASADIEQEYVERLLPQKVAIDLDYVENRSMLLDIQLLILTAASLLKKESHAARAPHLSPKE